MVNESFRTVEEVTRNLDGKDGQSNRKPFLFPPLWHSWPVFIHTADIGPQLGGKVQQLFRGSFDLALQSITRLDKGMVCLFCAVLHQCNDVNVWVHIICIWCCWCAPHKKAIVYFQCVYKKNKVLKCFFFVKISSQSNYRKKKNVKTAGSHWNSQNIIEQNSDISSFS